MAMPNAMVQESVRAFYTGWFLEVVDRMPEMEHGMIRLSEAPGLGAEFTEEFLARPDLLVRRSEG